MENPFENMRCFIIVILLSVAGTASAQNYHAVQGSPYAGSLGIANNPSSMLNTPVKWDVTLFGAQLKTSTNIVTIYDYSLLSNPRNSKYGLNKGEFARKGMMSFNANLLNTRITLDRRHALGFGVNLRGLLRMKTSSYNYTDSIRSSGDFIQLNNPANAYDLDFTGSTWVEIFGSYARTILDDQVKRLNTGITVKASRGISGAFITAENLRFRQVSNVRGLLTDARVTYGYSSNFDRWQKSKGTGQNIQDLVNYSEGGLSIDFGLEYLVKTQAPTTYEDDDYYDYNWKIGVSLLDMGVNQYKYGRESKLLSGLKDDVGDSTLDDKFRTANSLEEVNDSLETIVQNMGGLPGKFTVVNPMRLVVNVDRPLGNDFYVNGEVSINLSGVFKKYHHVSEMNLITVTPRWETRRWGAYLPVQYNAAGKFWIGGAFKAGPLLLGVHNWANVFSKTKITQGGGYIALVIRAWNDTRNKTDKRLNCPE